MDVKLKISIGDEIVFEAIDLALAGAIGSTVAAVGIPEVECSEWSESNDEVATRECRVVLNGQVWGHGKVQGYWTDDEGHIMVPDATSAIEGKGISGYHVFFTPERVSTDDEDQIDVEQLKEKDMAKEEWLCIKTLAAYMRHLASEEF
ncbi:MAG: hypothetical protein OXG15_02470 [Gammaproteobacteria bacterium]|nr:hypothetical protein [Gammaproteobacteria bacterium]